MESIGVGRDAMSLHDDYARRTPFELAFPDRSAVDDFVSAVDEEAEVYDVDASNQAAFSVLGAVGTTVRRLQGPQAAAESIQDYIALLYHAYHFVRHGRPLHLVTLHAARFLVEGAPTTDAVGDPPAPAGYAQLPQHLFWVGGEGDETAEPVDGFFWTVEEDGTLHLLLATGMREGRPGLAVVPLPEAPWAEADAWMRARIREGGADFATTLPGGELEGLYSLTAAGEVFKLAARLFAYERAVPEAVEKHMPPSNGHAGEASETVGASTGGEGRGPAPSVLPYRKVILHG